MDTPIPDVRHQPIGTVTDATTAILARLRLQKQTAPPVAAFQSSI